MKKFCRCNLVFRQPLSDKSQTGFTIIELLVVLAIMGVFFGLVLANYAGTRGRRDIKIAQNELVTNIRKVQSYVLAARDSSAGPVKYYVLKFDTSNSTRYVIEAVQTDFTLSPPLETINLPRGITIQSIAVQQPLGSSTTTPGCVQVAFSLPFNKMYADQECAIDLLVLDPASLGDYDDSLITLTLRDAQSSTTKTVTINGVSGVIDAQ